MAWQSGFIHSKTVVLAGDHHNTGVQVLNRVVRAVVAMTHFHGLGAGGQCQQLVAQADTEYRNFGIQNFLDGRDRVVARLRIARTVGQEHAIKEVLNTEIPVFGICLGHQLLALASGAKTVKMGHGHHGAAAILAVSTTPK